MASPRFGSVEHVPLHELFPEQYEATRKAIVRDFAYFGTTIVLGVVLAGIVNYAITASLAP